MLLVGYGEMDFVFDSTEDFPVAANPLVLKEHRVSTKASKGVESKKGDKGNKEKGAVGQKNGASANPPNLRVKKNKPLVIPEEDTTEDETGVEKSPHPSPQPITVGFEETEEERRGRKEKSVEHPVEVVKSFPQTYDFDEAELVATLVENLPQHVPNVGYIWQAGFPP